MGIRFFNRTKDENKIPISKIETFRWLTLAENCCINTGYKPNQNTEVRIRYNGVERTDGLTPTSLQNIFGCKSMRRPGTSGSYSQDNRFAFSNYNGGNFNFGTSDNIFGELVTKDEYGVNSGVEYKFNKQGVYRFNSSTNVWDLIYSVNNATIFQCEVPLIIGGQSSLSIDNEGKENQRETWEILSAAFMFNLRYFDIYENNILVKHFVPARRTGYNSRYSILPGLYDTVNGVFHPIIGAKAGGTRNSLSTSTNL